MTYSTYNLSSISNKTSCCGGDILPPCCAVGSIRINSTKCGKLPTNNNQHSGQTRGMRKLYSFGQPCAKFPRKILTRNVKIPLSRKIHENELRCSQKAAKRKRRREKENLTLLWQKYISLRVFCWFTVSFGPYNKIYLLLKCSYLLVCEFEKPESTV